MFLWILHSCFIWLHIVTLMCNYLLMQVWCAADDRRENERAGFHHTAEHQTSRSSTQRNKWVYLEEQTTGGSVCKICQNKMKWLPQCVLHSIIHSKGLIKYLLQNGLHCALYIFFQMKMMSWPIKICTMVSHLQSFPSSCQNRFCIGFQLTIQSGVILES